MEKANVKEYELIRDETEFIRDCITTYIGYTISGSGAALFGLAALRVYGIENRIVTAHVSYALALLVSLVLALLIYKFNTHNRYVGYARVITDERYAASPATNSLHDGAHIAWEICMERLRLINNYPQQFREVANGVKIHWQNPHDIKRALDWMLGTFIGGPGAPGADYGRTGRGFNQLRLALIGRTKTNSWGFPPHVVAIFCCITVLYILIGAYCTVSLAADGPNAPEIVSKLPEPSAMYRLPTLYVTSFSMLIVLAYLWRAFCRRLCILMEGSATVDGFSFRFMITRAEFLNSFSITPSYPSIERLMIDESKAPHRLIDPDPISF